MQTLHEINTILIRRFIIIVILKKKKIRREKKTKAQEYVLRTTVEIKNNGKHELQVNG